MYYSVVYDIVPGGLGVAEADITDRLQLAEVPDKDNGNISECAEIWIQPSFSAIGAFGLL